MIMAAKPSLKYDQQNKSIAMLVRLIDKKPENKEDFVW